MSPTRGMTKKEREIMQAMVDDSYEGFVDVISEGRHMSKAMISRSFFVMPRVGDIMSLYSPLLIVSVFRPNFSASLP